MHILDGKWTDLAAGYQAVQSLQARLETEFSRAVQAGNKQKFRKELTEWQKKRRVFLVMAAIAPLSIITLCLTAFYFREAACVIVYWTILVVIILVTLAIAGRNYIQEVLNRPKPEQTRTLATDLEQRWWTSLSPEKPAVSHAKDKEKRDFLSMLGKALPESCLATGEPGLLILCQAGIWLLQVETWSGTIIRQEGVWKQIETVRDKLGRKRIQEQTHEISPDDEWLHRKTEMVNILNERLARRAWTGGLIQGGVVFTHPKAVPDKPRIQGNTAAYGLAKAWVERIHNAPAVEGFTLEVQLEVLDALHEHQDMQAVSAKDEAWQLYQAITDELRLSIIKMVN